MNTKPAWDFTEHVKAIYKSVTKPLRLNIQFFAVEPELYSFGLADITLTKGDKTLAINGQDILQADGGEISLVPVYREISFKDFGDTIVQRRLAGWTGTVTFVVGQEMVDLLQLALSSVDEITDVATPANVLGVTDAKMGTALEGWEVNIHPRVLDAADKRFDFTIYQMASTGGITKPYNDEQTNYTITLEMMPRPGFDASTGANFFYTGPTDPNAA